MKNEIIGVTEGSAAQEAGIEAGDILLEINGKPINDVFDYRFYAADSFIDVLIEKKNAEQWIVEIEKDEYEELGISFADPMMDKAASCSNKCIFCFIDQLPDGMRETMYFKDDDNRLSFLQGNYVTLTNVTDKDLERVAYYHFSPINISVHTTDPDLRVKMLNNKNACKIMRQLKKLSDAGIELNCQIVLCKGINDGGALIKTIKDLSGIERVKSLSVVPVGLTKYREGLEELSPFDKEDAAEVLDIIHNEQKALRIKRGVNFVYASDEFYLKAGQRLPDFASYDDFPQLENGVGMIKLFENEFNECFDETSADDKRRDVTVVTGKSSYKFIDAYAKRMMKKFTNLKIQVIMVENVFFGETITVSGLLTGRDILDKLKKEKAAGTVLLPENAFKSDSEVFLDNMSLCEFVNELNLPARIVACSGEDFISAILECGG